MLGAHVNQTECGFDRGQWQQNDLSSAKKEYHFFLSLDAACIARMKRFFSAQ